MKKIFALLGTAVMSLAIVAGLAACSPAGSLAMEKRYYAVETDTALEDSDYYLFHKDGTGIRYTRGQYWDGSMNYPSEYTIYFDYSIIDKDKETILCVFDHVEAGDNNEAPASGFSDSDWSVVLIISENMIMTNAGSKYFNEDFLTAHPEFGA